MKKVTTSLSVSEHFSYKKSPPLRLIDWHVWTQLLQKNIRYSPAISPQQPPINSMTWSDKFYNWSGKIPKGLQLGVGACVPLVFSTAGKIAFQTRNEVIVVNLNHLLESLHGPPPTGNRKLSHARVMLESCFTRILFWPYSLYFLTAFPI